ECNPVFLHLYPRRCSYVLHKIRSGRHFLPEQACLVHIEYLFRLVLLLPDNGHQHVGILLCCRCIGRCCLSVQRYRPQVEPLSKTVEPSPAAEL
ncbi:hypothetical protein M514_14981, partial [Trichuris suis]